MTVCYNKIQFPVPKGLRDRPVVTAISRGVDLTSSDITYQVVEALSESTFEAPDDQGKLTCCSATQALVWPSTERLGALYPVEAGDYVFTALVDTGIGGFQEFTPAYLTVVDGAACTQPDCPPCVIGDCPPCSDIVCGEIRLFGYKYGNEWVDIVDDLSITESNWVVYGTTSIRRYVDYAPIRVAAKDESGNWIASSMITDVSFDTAGGYSWGETVTNNIVNIGGVDIETWADLSPPVPADPATGNFTIAANGSCTFHIDKRSVV